jgi:hypothetical protein
VSAETDTHATIEELLEITSSVRSAQQNKLMSPVEIETKENSAGEGQRQM